MKKFKTFMIFLLLMTFITIPTSAKDEKVEKLKKVIFMGTVSDVVKDNGNTYISIRAKGYLKGCTVYEEELVGIVSENTYLIKDKCGVENKDCKKEKVVLKDLKVEKGDTVFMVLDGVMTKSLPPQAPVRAILVNSAKK